MARYTGSKHKQSRREGINLTGTRSRSLDRRLNVQPGGRPAVGHQYFGEHRVDQQVAGVVMWAPAKIVHGVAVLLLAVAWLQATEARARAREAARRASGAAVR
jgi:hypothetical protein